MREIGRERLKREEREGIREGRRESEVDSRREVYLFMYLSI